MGRRHQTNTGGLDAAREEKGGEEEGEGILPTNLA